MGRMGLQRLDQGPVQTPQAHRLHRPLLGQCLEPEQHALLRQHPTRRPIAQVPRKLRALPHPKRLDASRHLREQLLDVCGTVQLTGVEADTLQRPALSANIVETPGTLGMSEGGGGGNRGSPTCPCAPTSAPTTTTRHHTDRRPVTTAYIARLRRLRSAQHHLEAHQGHQVVGRHAADRT